MGGQQSATENNTEKNKNELSKKEEENEYFILYVELEGKIWQVRFRPKRGEIKMQFIEFLEHQKVVKENEVYYVVQNKYAPLIPLWMSLRIPEHSLVYLFPLKLQKNSFPSPLQFPSPYRAKWCEISHFSNEMLENHLQKASNLKLSKILKKMRKSMEKRAFFEVEITNSDQKKIIDEAFTALEFFFESANEDIGKAFSLRDYAKDKSGKWVGYAKPFVNKEKGERSARSWFQYRKTNSDLLWPDLSFFLPSSFSTSLSDLFINNDNDDNDDNNDNFNDGDNNDNIVGDNVGDNYGDDDDGDGYGNDDCDDVSDDLVEDINDDNVNKNINNNLNNNNNNEEEGEKEEGEGGEGKEEKEVGKEERIKKMKRRKLIKEAKWKKDFFRKAIERLFQLQEEIAIKTTSLLLTSFDLSPTFLIEPMIDKRSIEEIEEEKTMGANVMRVYQYLRDKTEKLPGISNASTKIHSDMGFVTVSPRSNIPGLCILDPTSSRFENVEINQLKEGEKYLLNVFVGESFARLSDGALRATVHFVDEIQTGKSRFSMPFFMRGNPSSLFNNVFDCSLTISDFIEKEVLTQRPWRDPSLPPHLLPGEY